MLSNTTNAAKNVIRPIYLDFQATTPLDPRVLDTMMPFLTEQYGNPHSRTHTMGWEASEAVEDARAHIASVIHASPKDIVFTSGATESNNIAIKGAALQAERKGRKHIVTTHLEHKCVLESVRYLEARGFDVTYVPVDDQGIVDPNDLREILEKRPDTALVSVMAVNNEIGVIQDLEAIGTLCRKHGVVFHTDAAQGFGKIPLDVVRQHVDLMSISGHKIYGPKGVGALFVGRRPRIRLAPVISGGGQERGIRSGTVATPLAVGLGRAAELAEGEMDRDHRHISSLADKLWTGIQRRIPHVTLNGHPTKRYVGNLNVSFSYVEGESLIMGLHDVAVSSGSACTSASLEPSYVLHALGVPADQSHTSLRMGLGRFSTEDEVEFTLEHLAGTVGRLRELSPLYEMVQEGIDISQIKWASH
ncbi:cysteine desulfurase [Carpediemonas membranifera]|uniref:cysteine desulfurase n=1 Tax=Carpediemonas membranifera TaxID=201153 RepID=A0A8J6AX34_9EUKA|nr:cysteine desulfurase [Carpediemonas membranifera]|eukprot:KAG9394670.1 cysteine desulfurase [Carpediemonas membranifera]